MKVKAPAKINLMLDILRKLDNGYHSLFMVMQAIDLFDEVEVNKNTLDKISIFCDNSNVPCNEKNIAYRCAIAFFDYCNIEDRGIDIKIKKNIPMEAGLAGGSADGAAVLYCLNKIYKTNLSMQELCSVGVKVGADIPFSLTGGTAVVMGTGSIIAPVKLDKDYKILIVKPEQNISTPLAYSKYDELNWVRHIDRVAVIEATENHNYDEFVKLCGNVFEQAVEVPSRPHIKTTMRDGGSDACCMSGSGPSIFGLFSDKDACNTCYNKLIKNYKNVYSCSPYNYGITEILEENNQWYL